MGAGKRNKCDAKLTQSRIRWPVDFPGREAVAGRAAEKEATGTAHARHTVESIAEITTASVT